MFYYNWVKESSLFYFLRGIEVVLELDSSLCHFKVTATNWRYLDLNLTPKYQILSFVHLYRNNLLFKYIFWHKRSELYSLSEELSTNYVAVNSFERTGLSPQIPLQLENNVLVGADSAVPMKTFVSGGERVSHKDMKRPQQSGYKRAKSQSHRQKCLPRCQINKIKT